MREEPGGGGKGRRLQAALHRNATKPFFPGKNKSRIHNSRWEHQLAVGSRNSAARREKGAKRYLLFESRVVGRTTRHLGWRLVSVPNYSLLATRTQMAHGNGHL
jgi:hypothetical protein